MVFLRDLGRFRGTKDAIQMSTDNFIEKAWFQVAFSAGKGGQVG